MAVTSAPPPFLLRQASRSEIYSKCESEQKLREKHKRAGQNLYTMKYQHATINCTLMCCKRKAAQRERERKRERKREEGYVNCIEHKSAYQDWLPNKPHYRYTRVPGCRDRPLLLVWRRTVAYSSRLSRRPPAEQGEHKLGWQQKNARQISTYKINRQLMHAKVRDCS